MSHLRVYANADPAEVRVHTHELAEIQRHLGGVGVRFSRWLTNAAIEAGDAPEKVMDGYREHIDQLMSEGGYQAVDIISLTPSHPDKDALRQKFLNEHTHDEDEIRFFVAGQGLFTMHIGDEVYEVLCRRDDLIGVPAGTPHWFDMGPEPEFIAIRIFTNPAGWIARFTGSDISAKFPRLEAVGAI